MPELLTAHQATALEAAERATAAAFALHDRLYACTSEERLAKMLSAQATANGLIDEAEAAAERSLDRTIQARLWYLRGKAATCGREGRSCTQAERLLGDAVKLEPVLVDAWNVLGECFWQRGELEEARGCFEGALEHQRNAESLCHLSMLLRMLNTAAAADDEQQLAAERISESVSLAKEAVRLEAGKARAWSCLGCALLSSYAHGGGKLFDDLQQAHRAFSQASKAAQGCDPDLLMNHALAHFLLDASGDAIGCYSAAHALDPTLGGAAKRQEVWEQACRVQELLASKGGLKPKRLAQLVAELPPLQEPPLQPAALARLAEGVNPKARVLVKLIAPLPAHASRRHHCYVVADRSAQVMALSVYMAAPPLQMGATLELHAPSLVNVCVSRWQPAPAAAHVDGAASVPTTPSVEYQLLRIEQPATQLRIGRH